MVVRSTCGALGTLSSFPRDFFISQVARCVLGEMFTRKPILPGTSDLDQLEKIFFLCGSPNQHNWPYFDSLPGCEGVIRFNSHTRRIKHTYERFVSLFLS